MINEVIINEFPPFKKDTTLEFAQINLFVGKNGSGKTRFLRELERCVNGNISNGNTFEITKDVGNLREPFYRITEERSSQVRDRGLQTPTTVNAHGKNTQDLFSNYTLSDELKKQFNYEFSSLINRTLIISKGEGKGVYAEYEKNGFERRPNEDGFGILNMIYLYQFPYLAPEKSIISIEEPTIGLYPALSEPFLTILTESVIGKNKQLIYTSHDVFTMLYFINNVRQHSEYKLFRFYEDQKNEINIESYDSKKINDFTSDFFGDFPKEGQIKSLKTLLDTLEGR